MKKILISTVIPLFFVMIIWLVNFQFTYGDLSLLTKSHVNLKAMFERFNLNRDLSTDFSYTFSSMLKTFNKLASSGVVSKISPNLNSLGWSIVFQGVESFLNPIYAIAYPMVVLGYFFVLIIQFLGITTAVATALFDFIFNPIFIFNDSISIIPVSPVIDLPPVIPNPGVAPL